MTRRGPTDSAAVRWLIDQGVWLPQLTHAENMQRCADYRARLVGSGRFGAEPGKQWARELVARYRAGESLPPQFVRLAMQALGMQPETILAKPGKAVPKPDRMEQAAGDVEVRF